MIATSLNYDETPEFKKDFKALLKRFKTLTDDLSVAKKAALELFHLKKIDNQSIVPVSGIAHKKFQIFKLRKFACRSLKGLGVKSGIRIIYAYDSVAKKVVFLEIYFKADQVNEDKKRIKAFFLEENI